MLCTIYVHCSVFRSYPIISMYIASETFFQFFIFFPKRLHRIPLYGYIIIYLTGLLLMTICCLQSFAIINNSVMNDLVHTLFYTFISIKDKF